MPCDSLEGSGAKGRIALEDRINSHSRASTFTHKMALADSRKSAAIVSRYVCTETAKRGAAANLHQRCAVEPTAISRKMQQRTSETCSGLEVFYSEVGKRDGKDWDRYRRGYHPKRDRLANHRVGRISDWGHGARGEGGFAETRID